VCVGEAGCVALRRRCRLLRQQIRRDGTAQLCLAELQAQEEGLGGHAGGGGGNDTWWMQLSSSTAAQINVRALRADCKLLKNSTLPLLCSCPPRS
jgi:hypothetical protein